MSLTSHLKNKQSPVRQFIHDRFPNTRALTKEASAVIKGARTTRPDGPEKIPPTIGGAIDYRARYFFPAVGSRSLVAWSGAKLAATPMVDGFDAIPQVSATIPSKGEGNEPYHAELEENVQDRHPSGGIVADFFENLHKFLADSKPAGKHLDRGSEETLARYCYVLALFEEVFRAGPWPTSILFQQKYQSVDELLSAVPSRWVDDIAAMSAIFYRRFESHFGEPVTLNPTFEGSSDVAGADGDLILGKCLIDLKATINPRLSPDWLRQLVGYVLLDYSDIYRMDSVGIYLIRQDVLLRWPMEKFIRTLCDEQRSLPSLRKEFQDVTQSL